MGRPALFTVSLLALAAGQTALAQVSNYATAPALATAVSELSDGVAWTAQPPSNIVGGALNDPGLVNSGSFPNNYSTLVLSGFNLQVPPWAESPSAQVFLANFQGIANVGQIDEMYFQLDGNVGTKTAGWTTPVSGLPQATSPPGNLVNTSTADPLAAFSPAEINAATFELVLKTSPTSSGSNFQNFGFFWVKVVVEYSLSTTGTTATTATTGTTATTATTGSTTASPGSTTTTTTSGSSTSTTTSTASVTTTSGSSTTATDTPAASSSGAAADEFPLGIVIGAAAGGCCLLLLIVVAIVVFMKKRSSDSSTSERSNKRVQQQSAELSSSSESGDDAGKPVAAEAKAGTEVTVYSSMDKVNSSSSGESYSELSGSGGEGGEVQYASMQNFKEM